MYITRRGKLPRWIRAAQQISNPLFRRKRLLESTCPVFETYSMERLLCSDLSPRSFSPPSTMFIIFVPYFSIYFYPFRSTHLKTYLRIFIKLVFYKSRAQSFVHRQIFKLVNSQFSKFSYFYHRNIYIPEFNNMENFISK